MGNIKALALSAALFGSMGGAALAADLLPPPPMLPPAPVADQVEYSGWYLRGDVGIGASGKPGLNYDMLNCAGGSNGAPCYGGRNAGKFLQEDLTDQGIIGIGVGYAVNSWFRTDATLEYRSKATFTGVDQFVCNSGCFPGAQSNTGYTINSQWHGNVSSIVAMLNGYADLGTWNSITPYVGAGVGVAYNRTSGIMEMGTVYTDPNNTNGTYYTADQQISNGASKMNFAWALMAGLSYSVNANTKLDIGYRYMHLGKAVTGYETQVPTSYAYENLKAKSLTAQDFRIGMRWMLGGPTTTAYAEPALIRKY